MEWDQDYAIQDLMDLAHDHSVSIIWDGGEYAITDHRVVHISTPYNAAKYLVALHEFGHILSPRARHFEKRCSRPRTSSHAEYDDYALCEAAAWAWAARFCDDYLYEQISDKTWKQVGSLFATCLPYVRDIKVGPPSRKEPFSFVPH